MTKQSRILLPFLCVLLCITFSVCPASAEEASLPNMEEASAVYFYHLDSKTLVLSKNTQTVLCAGSTPKIIAGLIACEALSERLNEEVTVTSEMVATSAGYRYFIKAGDVLSVKDLLYIALCGSYNDAYDILAHIISGSLSSFVDLMNEKAHSLGAKNTHYTDPSGISDSSVTTAEDMATIAREAYQNELYMTVVSTVKYEFGGSLKLEPSQIYNRNALIASNRTTLYYNSICRGMNAGYTERGKSCVITVADNGKERYLSIVMGAPETDDCNYGYTVTNRLIDWVYETYTYLDVVSPDKVICKIPVTVSDFTTEIEVRTKETLPYYLPKNAEIGKEITYSVRLINTELEAPVADGQMVGYVAVLYNGTKIGTLPIYTSGTAERSSFVSNLLNLKNLTQNRVFVSGTIFFVTVLLAWIITEYVLYRRRHHKWDKYFSSTMTPSADALKPKPKNEQALHKNDKLPR